MKQLIPCGNNHIFVCGLTRSGKSFFARNALRESKYPVLYLNIQDEDLPGYIKVRSDRIYMKQLKDALHDGNKIALSFNNLNLAYSDTFKYIVSFLMDRGGFSESDPMYLAVDECHLIHGSGKEAARIVSTAGLKKGIRCMWITQRPAICDKTIYTQALEHYIFYIPVSDREYMRTKGIEYDDCIPLWGQPGSRQYVYYDGYKLEGRPAISGGM